MSFPDCPEPAEGSLSPFDKLVPHAQDERSILQDTPFLLAIREGRQA